MSEAPSSRAEGSGVSEGSLAVLIDAFRAGRGLDCDAPARVIETHISYVVLTGRLAYKLKKPVRFSFVDFSTLARRRHFLTEELRLNRRTAPSLYLRVVPITGTPRCPVLDGTGTAFEYALEMLEFDQAGRLDRLLATGKLSVEDVEELARSVASFHEGAARVSPDQGYGCPDRVRARVMDNFESLEASADTTGHAPIGERLARLRAWSMATLSRLGGSFDERRRDGFVRECHGDLHLANIALIEERPVPFDCIEFDEDLRWIDVASEIAFTIMDFDFHHGAAFGNLFLNRYLEHTGDYAGLALLRHYLCYRALVRGKVSGLRLRDPAPTAAERSEILEDLLRHLDLAERYAAPVERAPLLITHGLSGSGKSWVAERVAAVAGAIRIRSDVERKRIWREELYSQRATEATYERLAELARLAIEADHAVIVDATFLGGEQRTRFEHLARQLGAPFAILSLEAPEPVLRERIAERAKQGGDPSDATLEVLERQIRSADPLSERERRLGVSCDTTTALDAEALWGRLCASAEPRSDCSHAASPVSESTLPR